MKKTLVINEDTIIFEIIDTGIEEFKFNRSRVDLWNDECKGENLINFKDTGDDIEIYLKDQEGKYNLLIFDHSQIINLFLCLKHYFNYPNTDFLENHYRLVTVETDDDNTIYV